MFDEVKPPISSGQTTVFSVSSLCSLRKTPFFCLFYAAVLSGSEVRGEGFLSETLMLLFDFLFHCCRFFSDHLLEQVGGVLVLGDAGRDAVVVGDLLADGDLEAIVVETVAMVFGHLREFEVVGGNDRRHIVP